MHRWYDNLEVCYQAKDVVRFHVAEDRAVATEHSKKWGVTNSCLTASSKLLPSGVCVSLAGLCK